jgi:hypothetical protein
MKALRSSYIIVAMAIAVFGCSSCGAPAHVSVGAQYVNPAWAPPYYSGVRYYYFPDIEVYYDLADQEFVYLLDGRWLFSSVLPPVYSSYDLYNSFVIALNINVYQPWLHHHFYVSHYPRYYYHNVYSRNNMGNIRGFNENAGKPVYWQGNDRNRMNETRRNEVRPPKVEIHRPPQEPHYYGKDIGRPVRVRPQMRSEGGDVRRGQ